jgi:hypothetical protein
MSTPEDDQQVRQIVQTWPSTPGQAQENLKPLAANGNARAAAILAIMLLQSEAFEESITYARQAIEAGAGAIAQTFAVDFASRGREDLRMRAPEFLGQALEGGWTVDLRNLLVQAVGEGKDQAVSELLDLAFSPAPPSARNRWDALVAKAESDQARITTAADSVAGERDVANQQISATIQQAEEHGEEIARLANDLGVLTNKAGAISLAEAYSHRAEAEEMRGQLYTRVSVALGVVTVIVIALVAILTLKEHTSVTTAAQRAAFGLPLALLAAYINRLASAYRDQAWKLRHVELQLRTVNPFLAGLEDQRRKEVLAELALLFFPGHEVLDKPSGAPPAPAAVSLDADQVLSLLGRLVQRESLGSSPTGSAPGATSPAQ